MASLHHEILIDVPAERLWDAMRDVGALHTRLAPGFVTGCRMEGELRHVAFGNGATVVEPILSIDDERRRVAWAATGGRLQHYSASTQVFEEGSGRCRVRWIADLLPHAAAPAVSAMIEAGLAAMKQHAEVPR